MQCDVFTAATKKVFGNSFKWATLFVFSEEWRWSLTWCSCKELASIFLIDWSIHFSIDFWSRKSEIFQLFDFFLATDPKTRARNLGVRSYHVTPLGPEMGLIEWVADLTSFKEAVCPLYRRKSVHNIQANYQPQYKNDRHDYEQYKKSEYSKFLSNFLSVFFIIIFSHETDGSTVIPSVVPRSISHWTKLAQGKNNIH